MRTPRRSPGRTVRSPTGPATVVSSAAVGPAITDSISAASRTDVASGPSTDSDFQPLKPGSLGTRPNVGLWPTTPQKAAGIRIEPPPSVPTARWVSPAATDAPAPPLEPPGVRPESRGLRVRPYTRLSVTPR